MRNKQNKLRLLLLFLVPLTAFGQEEELVIPSLYPPIDGYYLEDIIFADTAGAGQTAWAEGRRVYVLQRDAIYPSRTQINLAPGRRLKIRCEYGTTGYKPEIWIYDALGSTRPPGNFVSANGTDNEIKLTNVNISGYEEDFWGEVDGVNGGLVRLGSISNGSRIVIDSCILKSTSGYILRTDGNSQAVIVENSIFADMGNLVTSNLAAGRAMDLRARQIDTLYVCNNTFVNFQDRLLRHYASTVPIVNLWFNNNTIVNGLSFHGMLSLGNVDNSGTFEINNNLLIDNFALGADTCASRQSEFDENGVIDPNNGLPKMFWIIAEPNYAVNWSIENNFYTVSDSGAYMFNALPPLGPPFYQYEGPIIPPVIEARILPGADYKFGKVVIQPANVPLLMTSMIRWFYRPYADGGAGKGKGGPLDPTYLGGYIAPGIWAYDYNRKSMQYYTDTLDCDFLCDTTLTGIGDPRWQQLPGLPTGTDLLQAQGWNLVSIPREQRNYDLGAVFPCGPTPIIYEYNTTTGGYDAVTIGELGKGYWVYCLTGGLVTVRGVAPSVPVYVTATQAGWILIGSRAWQIKLSDIELSNGAMINGSAYSYNPVTSSYIATSVINPGEGVWINVSKACIITFP